MIQKLHAQLIPVTTPRLNAGFTLVELMVSMVISLVILAAMVGIFVNTSNRNRELERANGMIENGRLAIQVLENDVVHAGYWGGYVPPFDDQTFGGKPTDVAFAVPTAVPDPCLAYASWTPQYVGNMIGVPVQAYEDKSFCGTILGDKRNGTDVLVVRHAETCMPDPAVAGAGCDVNSPGDADSLYLQVSRCDMDPAPVPGVIPFVLDQGTDLALFPLRQRGCVNPSEKRRFISNLYYVRDYAVNPGDGIPTLMRSTFEAAGGDPEHQPPVELIEGIDGFKVEFGVDDVGKTGGPVDYTAAIDWADPNTQTTANNRGDGSPDEFIHCTTASAAPCTASSLMNVTAVKIYVLARSREPSQGYKDTKKYDMGGTLLGPFNDKFKRHLFVTTIRLPNVAGRRETP